MTRPASTLRARVERAAAKQVDIASLAVFRILFGVVMAGSALRVLTAGWIGPMYEEPRWFFSYPGFAWVKPWPAPGMYVHYGVLLVLALAVAAGWHYRVALGLFLVGFLYSQLVDVTNYLNHHYLVVLLAGLLIVLPAHAAWSLDARAGRVDRRETVPAWMVWLLRFQIGVVYVFAGLAKLKADWLLHGQPLNLWLAARTETPIVGGLFGDPRTALAMSWAGFLFDTTIALWLSWRRTRLVAFGALVAFHGATGYLFNIGLFPVIMTTGALIFFAPDWPRRLLRRAAVSTEGVAQPPRRAARIAIGIYVVVQIALPLRHVVYPGALLWNEDGMRFAWHVLIREKHGSVTYVAKFANGKQLEIPPGRWLTWRQEREMSGQPDLILQLARAIDRDLAARGFHDYTLHVITGVSLNGRRPAPLIDPAVDLRTLRDIGSRDWVLPAPSEAPPVVKY